MKSDRLLAGIIAIFGALSYAHLMFSSPVGDSAEQYGTFVYNYYFLSLIEGRLDIPLRIITLEGHYDSSGRAFVYHGIGPLLTRAIAYPFVDLTKVSLAPVTIWFFSAAGSAMYHFLFLRALSRFGPTSTRLRAYYGAVLGVMVWFISPGIYLTVNESIYHEPIAMCYFAVGAFLVLFSGPAFYGKDWKPILVPLAILAGIAVLTRPHVAIGLYAGVALLLIHVLRKNGRQGIPSVIVTLLVLLAFGVLQLIINELRFGEMFKMHGSLQRDSLERGFSYFGVEDSSSLRAQAFREQGRFNIARIIPNGMLYLFDALKFDFGPYVDPYGIWIQNLYLQMATNLGRIGRELPRVGMVFLWLPWIFLIVVALPLKRVKIQQWWAVLVAASIATGMVLAYATITLRYRTDIWPLIAVLAVYSLPKLWDDSERHPIKAWGVLFITAIAFVLSFLLALKVVVFYVLYFSTVGLYGQWSQQTCAEMVIAKEQLGPDDVERLCTIPVE